MKTISINLSIVILIVLIFKISTFALDIGSLINKGNRFFKKGNYEKALELYREAQIKNPNNPIINFNIGSAEYKLGNYEEAKKEYNRAISTKDKRIKSATFYNLGNTAFRQNKYDEALEYYKKALELNPNDEDSKYNYEYILNLKNNKESQKNKSDNSENENKNKENNNNKKTTEQKDQNKDTMSKEDAQRILQFYDEQDKNAAKKRKMMMPKIPEVEEDW